MEEPYREQKDGAQQPQSGQLPGPRPELVGIGPVFGPEERGYFLQRSRDVADEFGALREEEAPRVLHGWILPDAAIEL